MDLANTLTWGDTRSDPKAADSLRSKTNRPPLDSCFPLFKRAFGATAADLGGSADT